ncbi:MAG: MgtC/SapB family protein [Limnochordia bacterium]
MFGVNPSDAGLSLRLCQHSRLVLRSRRAWPAQVVSGIGFLGAGSIIREGPSIKGLTTAASLWVVAGIGLAVGSGFLFAAVFATVLAILALTVLDKAERKLLSTKHSSAQHRDPRPPGDVRLFVFGIGDPRHVDIRNVTISQRGGGTALLDFQVQVPPNPDTIALLDQLTEHESVRRAGFHY